MSKRPHIYCLVEGYSEKNFVHRIIAPHLSVRGIDITAPMVMTSFDRRIGQKFKGGGRSFVHWHRDLENLWLQHRRRDGIYFTTMLDFYGLPSDFPGFGQLPTSFDFRAKINFLETKLHEHATALGISADRFTPYLAAHEFETMVFTDLDALGTLFLDNELSIQGLKNEISTFSDIESINSSPEGAPSKRIEKYIPIYGKYKRSDQSGIVNVLEIIELPRIRLACHHLNEWIQRLESLVNKPLI